MIQHVALVTEVTAVDSRWLTRVAAALQKQVIRDFRPIWHVDATVAAFESLDDVPIGYWPLILVEDVKDAAGVHLDKNGQPFALVEVGASWSLTASHECLEMLADPFGNRLIPGPSPEAGQGRVEFLVEICDPSEDQAYAYRVNGVLVSDFYTPSYFSPTEGPHVRYSFTGAITAPRQVLSGGYLSWHDPVTDHWFQRTFFGNAPTTRDLGVFQRDGRSLREIIDSVTPQTKLLSHLAADGPVLTAAAGAIVETEAAATSKASALRSQIASLKDAAKALDFTGLR
jgi:hypothetical protein